MLVCVCVCVCVCLSVWDFLLTTPWLVEPGRLISTDCSLSRLISSNIGEAQARGHMRTGGAVALSHAVGNVGRAKRAVTHVQTRRPGRLISTGHSLSRLISSNIGEAQARGRMRTGGAVALSHAVGNMSAELRGHWARGAAVCATQVRRTPQRGAAAGFC